MAKQLQIRGGTTAQHSTFTGAVREITVDTDKDVIVVHDGTTVGGFPLAKQTSVDSKVAKVISTDNAVVRFNGTTGAVQDSSVIIDDNGNVGIGHPNPTTKLEVIGNIKTSCSGLEAVNTRGITWSIDGIVYGRLAVDNSGSLLYIGNGGLGYGPGSGGTVTQLTSKSTAVTLNKPTGQIFMNNAALAAGASVTFALNNTLINGVDGILLSIYANSQTAQGTYSLSCATNPSVAYITLTNKSATSYSDSLAINFQIIKGAIA